MTPEQIRKAKTASIAFLLWLTILLLVVLAGCELAGPDRAPQSPTPEPWIRIDTATVHYWGHRGYVEIVASAPVRTRIRVYEPLCNRTIINEWLPEDGRLGCTWQHEWKCPPSPYGYDAFHAVLYTPDSVIATDVYKQHERFGGP